MPISPVRLVTEQLDCTVTRDGDSLFAAFRGAIDFYTARRAKELLLDLLDQEPAGLTIDARDAFVDSSGIGVFLHVAQRARLERRSFHLLCHERLQHILRVHKLEGLLGLADPPRDLKSLRSSGRIAA